MQNEPAYPFFSFLLALFLQGISVSQVVDGDSQEDVEQDVVTADEQDDEVKTEIQENSINSADIFNFNIPSPILVAIVGSPVLMDPPQNNRRSPSCCLSTAIGSKLHLF